MPLNDSRVLLFEKVIQFQALATVLTLVPLSLVTQMQVIHGWAQLFIINLFAKYRG